MISVAEPSPEPTVARHTVRGACPHDCPDTCALLTTVENGVAVRVQGNPAHAQTGGVLCAKVSKYPERTYHQDRILTPLKRSGPKGSGQFAQVGWDEALTDIAARLAEIAARNPEAIVPYSYAGTMGVVQKNAGHAFFHALGASRLARTICSPAKDAGFQAILGSTPGPDPEAAAEAKEEEPVEPEPPAISDEMPDEKLLDVDKLIITRAEDGTPRLEVKDECCHIGFRATRLFPISRRHDYISIADLTGTEIGIIESLRKMDKAMRRIVLEEIRRRYFVPQITYVHSLKDEFGVLYWDVDTSRGRRKFVVREARDNIREFESGRMQITDVDGNLFEIPDIDRLPGKDVGELYRLL